MSAVEPGITLLEASAGTGKTFRIAHLFLRLVADEGLDVRAIVVVTFTEAATAELRHRIRTRLRDARLALAGGKPADEVLEAWRQAVADPGIADLRLREALNEFDEASISTIHAFCQRILRRHAFESGASFRADLTGDVRTLLDDVVSDFWSRLTHDADPAMLPALKTAGVTRDLLTDLADKARDPDVPVLPRVPLQPPPDVSDWKRTHAALRASWRWWEVRDALRAADLVERKTKAHPVSFPPTTTENHARWIQYDLWRVSPTEVLPEAVTWFREERLRAGTRSSPPPTHPALDALEAFALAHEALREPLLAYVQSLKLRLVDEVRERLPRLLRALNLRAYDDLLRDLRDALADPARSGPLRDAVRARLEVALVDEFQDTDPVQWDIFRTLFDQRLVLIGDPKQAIYGFRGADVHTYARASHIVTRNETLRVNFRSDEPLVRAVNHVFGRAGLTRPFGADTPTYPEVTAHHPVSRRTGDDRPALEIRFLPRENASLSKGILDRRWLEQRLPELVAADVVAELERGTIGPGDCAVLVRSNAQARAIAHALRARGVPAVRRSDDRVWKSEIAGELVPVLAAILEPGNPGLRRTALLTVLLGRTGEDLASLEADDLAAADVSERFHRWHARWIDDGVGPMLQALIDDEGVLERLLGGDEGQRRATDLLHLADLLQQVSRAEGLGPTALLSWVRRGGSEAEDAILRLSSDEPAVQVATVHGAKGLEYPFVWCPTLWSGAFLTARDKAHLVFHDPDADDRRTLDIGSDAYDEHLARREEEQLQEDLRLVYVALTRARHRCVVYWGAAAYSSALGYLLHQKPDDGDVHDRVNSRLRHKSDADLLAQLHEVLASPNIGLTEVDWENVPTRRWRPRASTPPTLAVRTLTRTLAPDRLWRRTSFTALLRGVDDHDPAPHVDHDGGEDVDEAELATARVPLADLPRGAHVGTFLHGVLEVHDFTRPHELRGVLERHLPAHGLPLALADALEPALHDVLATTVGGVRLDTLRPEQRLNELEFAFPLRGGTDTVDALTVRELADAFRHPDAPAGFADRLARLEFLPVRGFLVGSIDLVWSHGGRFALADWKSNHLGPTWSSYERPALEHEMAVARYQLQAHLYAVALHRWLRLRVPDYAWDRHVEGVHYLFLRGMHPDRSTGVYSLHPTAALVAHLDDVLGGGR
ncbi:MAG: exodeoxyribonuclease V subunit beta [Alphaproteobacteria bacterium]|nr:exodeoxyribonuclease V subunit beta [Alphaproteobacteria bacterium]MCB9696267.1 exodeoxyribonuclease V subunit beta [Alphaproteobacteria bacterium]